MVCGFEQSLDGLIGGIVMALGLLEIAAFGSGTIEIVMDKNCRFVVLL